MMKSRKQKSLQFQAVLLSAFMLMQSVTPVQAGTVSSGLNSLNNRSTVRDFSISGRLAEVDERFSGSAREALWIIRDAHGIPAAQSAIYRILAELEKNNEVLTVAAEGVEGDFHTAFFRAFPDSAALKKALKRFWLRGELAGAALAALSPSHADYFGMENTALYEKQLRSYIHARSEQEFLLSELGRIQSDLKSVRGQFYSPELAAFVEKTERFQKRDAAALIEALQSGRSFAADFNGRFPHLAAAMQEASADSADQQEVKAAFSRWIQVMEKQLAPNSAGRKTWNGLLQSWKTGEMTDASFLSRSAGLSTRSGKIRLPRILESILRRGELLSKMRSGIFMSEWDEFAAAVSSRLASTAEAREALALERQAAQLERRIKLESLPNDKRVKNAEIRTAQLQNAASLLSRLSEKIEASASREFYDLAEAREKAMLKNTLSRLKKSGRSRAAMIVGGYHADTLAAELKKRKISYVVVTPRIQSLPAENRYDELMQGQVSWKEFFKTQNGRLNLYESFARAMTHELLDLKNQKKNPEGSLRYYKMWRQNLMRGRGEEQMALRLLDEIVLETLYPEEYSDLNSKWNSETNRIRPVMERLRKMAGRPAAATANPQVTLPLVTRAVEFPAALPKLKSRAEMRDIQSVVQIIFEGPGTKLGGLADVGNDLPPAMQTEFPQADVLTIMPWHEGASYNARVIKEFSFDSPEGKVTFSAAEATHEGSKVILLRKNDEALFNGYSGDLFRIAALFSKAAVEYLAQSGIQPDVLHAHDQTAAYVPAFVRFTRESNFRNTGVFYTAHHLAPEYQGRVYDYEHARSYLAGLGLNGSELFSEGGAFYLRPFGHDRAHLNPVLSAIKLSDGVTTVDPEFAREAASEGWDFTEGLRPDLHHRWENGTFIGIPNALNPSNWDPAVAQIGHRGDRSSKSITAAGIQLQPGAGFFDWKRASKVWLQQQLGLPVDPDAPLLFLASRLTRVKGPEAVLQAMPEVLQRFAGAQLVVAGIGDSFYMDQFAALAAAPLWGGRVSFRPFFLDPAEMRAGFAAADFFLSPTTIAPFEIAPSQAKPFGAPSIVTNTGGLMRITDPGLDRLPQSVRLGYRSGGLLHASAAGFGAAVTEALMHHQMAPDYMTQVVQNVRGAVPSWQPVTHKYWNFYRTILANRLDFIGEHDQAKQLRAQVSARAELRAESPLMKGVTEGKTDHFFVFAAIRELLNVMSEKDVQAVSLQAIADRYIDRKVTQAQVNQRDIMERALDAVVESGLLTKSAAGYAPVNVRALAVQANHPGYIRADLARALASGQTAAALSAYQSAMASGPMDPVEGKWVVLKAVSHLNEGQKKSLRAALGAAAIQDLSLVRLISAMLAEQDLSAWMHNRMIEELQANPSAIAIPTHDKKLKIYAIKGADRLRLILVKNTSERDSGLEVLGQEDHGTAIRRIFIEEMGRRETEVLELRNALTNEFYSGYTVGSILHEALKAYIPADSNEDWQALDLNFSRSEMRKENAFVNPNDFSMLSGHNIYSRQFEAGLPRHLLESLESAAKTGADQLIEEFGFDSETAATLAAQVNLTGGLGALMPDLFEAWEANGLPVTGIHPLWNWIKNRPEKAMKDGKRLYLGAAIKKFMEPAPVQEFEVKLNVTPAYRGYAQNSRARELLTPSGHKKIMVRVYQTESHFQKAPQKYLDAYYVENGQEVPVFGEVYDDDYALRDFQMAVFSQASQILIQKLEGQDDPENIVLLDHEVFVSLPASRLKNAKLATLNHTVFRPGLYEPSENSYELLDFPEWLRSTIAHDKKISIADYTAEAYDLLTGVGLVEHVPALRTNIFRWGWQKLRGWADGKRRSTNGVYLPRWQSYPRRKLIEDYKKRLQIPAPEHQLPAEASDRAFFAELDKPANSALKKDFMHKNEAVGASDAAELLVWLYKEHNIPWIQDSLSEFAETQGSTDSLIADLGSFRADINSMIESGAEGDSRWETFFKQRDALIQALLRDPIGANVRRQVPYKGPDKYVEILQDILLNAAKAQSGESFDQGALFNRIKEQIRQGNYSDDELQRLRASLSKAPASKEAREQMARVIIGGRTFDYGAYDRFLYIRFLAYLMGLESRFATVENYNYHEARLIFKGAQAGIMLSDEILEASATSMEKAQTNMAEVIGVFGGAVPEIWIIRDKKSGTIKEVLDQDGDPAMFHDELRQKLQSDEWEILNGILVEYQDGSKSQQVGGLRRPSAKSLQDALKQLRTSRADPETRRTRMYDTVASSWKVDMVTSQAQAHAYLIENMLKSKAEKKKLAEEIKISDSDFTAAAKAENFSWDVRRENLLPSRRGGLIGFASAFRWLKSWQKQHAEQSDRMASRGEDAMAALEYHSKRGDIFNYLLKALNGLTDGAEPLRRKIRALQEEAARAPKDRFAVALNTEAIELVDQYLLNAAGKWLEEYLADETTAERLNELRLMLEQSAVADPRQNETQQPWAEYLARYLDHHRFAKPLPTSERGVRSFIFQKPGAKAVLVNLSVYAPSTEEQAEGRTIRKSRATIYLNEETAGILGGTTFNEKAVFRVVEPKRGKTFKLHTAAELTESIGTGIEMPLGVEVLALQPAEGDLAGIFSQAFQPRTYVEAVASLEQKLQTAAGTIISDKLFNPAVNDEEREALKRQLYDLARLDPRSAEHLFTRDGRKAVMAFILMAAPEYFNLTREWHHDFFDQLNTMRQKHWEFFKEGSQVRLLGSSRRGTIALARQDEKGNLLFSSMLFYVPPSEINFDGKVNTTISGIEGLVTKAAYKVLNALTGDDYGTRSDLLNNWIHRISAAESVQFLIVTPQRGEMRAAAGAPWWQDGSKTHLVVSVPVSMLRDPEKNRGIGKFTDLPGMYARDFQAIGAQAVLHLLPHFSITGEGPYEPVDLNSVNEDLIDWDAVPGLSSLDLPADNLPKDKIDYQAVRKLQMQQAQIAFNAFKKTAAAQARSRYQSFLETQRSWLDAYADFMALHYKIGRPYLERDPQKKGQPIAEDEPMKKWTRGEIESARSAKDFEGLKHLHRFAQWVAFEQLQTAVQEVQKMGGKVIFDLPGMAAKDSAIVMNHPELFHDPEDMSAHPGVVKEGVDERWETLAVYDAAGIKKQNYEPLLAPLRRWMQLFDGVRIDYAHGAFEHDGKWPFKSGSGQYRYSGDSLGEEYVAAVKAAIGNKLAVAEAFEGKADIFEKYGYVAVGRNFKRFSSHDDPRFLGDAGGFWNQIQNSLRDGVTRGDQSVFLGFTIRDFEGDMTRVKEIVPGQRAVQWRARVSMGNAADHRRFDMQKIVSAWLDLQSRLAQDKSEGFEKPLAVLLARAANLFIKPVPGSVEIYASSTDWFTQEWGRDTFISITGLLTATGRYEEAKSVFRRFAELIKGGLLPNRIPDSSRPELTIYNTSDASLLFIQAVRDYAAANPSDKEFIREMIPQIQKMVDAYGKTQGKGPAYDWMGETHEAYRDTDGLIVTPPQSTWMDAAPHGNDPVTPRAGKTVENNALWYSALTFLAQNTDDAEQAKYQAWASQAQASFQKFWNPNWKAEGVSPLKDVLDAVKPEEESLVRPNMLFAVALTDDLLTSEQQAVIVKVVQEELLTPYGMRTLSPRHEGIYQARYDTGRPAAEKDLAYHQGTVWPWPIGRFIDAWKKTEGKALPPDQQKAAIFNFLKPLLLDMLRNSHLSLPEVYDGSPRETGRQEAGGTSSQAWSIAEVLRVLAENGLIDLELLKQESARWIQPVVLSQNAKVQKGGAEFEARIAKRPGLKPEQLTVQIWTHGEKGWKAGAFGLPLHFEREDGDEWIFKGTAAFKAGHHFEYIARASAGLGSPAARWNWYSEGNGSFDTERPRSELRAQDKTTAFDVAYAAFALHARHPAHTVPGVIVTQNAEGLLNKESRQYQVRRMIDALDAWVEAQPEMELNLGFTMAYEAGAADELVLFAQKIQALKAKHGDRIHNRLRVLFTADQLRDPAAAAIAQQIKEAQAQVQIVEGRVRLDPEVFAYGLDSLGIEVPAGFEHLSVLTAGYSSAAVFPAALELNLQTASMGKLTAAVLDQIPQELARIFGRFGRSLRILPGILEAKWLEAAASRLISTAA